MDEITRLISQYIDYYISDMNDFDKHNITLSAKREIIQNIDRKIALALSEDKIAQLLVLLDDESVPDSEIEIFLNNSGISLENIVYKECCHFLN